MQTPTRILKETDVSIHDDYDLIWHIWQIEKKDACCYFITFVRITIVGLSDDTLKEWSLRHTEYKERHVHLM